MGWALACCVTVCDPKCQWGSAPSCRSPCVCTREWDIKRHIENPRQVRSEATEQEALSVQVPLTARPLLLEQGTVHFGLALDPVHCVASPSPYPGWLVVISSWGPGAMAPSTGLSFQGSGCREEHPQCIVKQDASAPGHPSFTRRCSWWHQRALPPSSARRVCSTGSGSSGSEPGSWRGNPDSQP